MNRILVIRGGALGDFILTLPTLRALRIEFPKAEIDLLGYKHIAEIARHRFYANQVRSIEYGGLSRFFARNGELPADLADYFACFDMVISYLFDPDCIFTNNLERCGVENILIGPARIAAGSHAIDQLAAPLAELGLRLEDPAARVFPSEEDRRFARDFIAPDGTPLIAIHPGSGSKQKNWPIENWMELGNALLGEPAFAGRILVIVGEADDTETALLRAHWNNPRVRIAKSLPLPELAALLEQSIFVGHDSGISHLAAATGAKCLLLFGPTDPAIWAPRGDNIQVIRAAGGELAALSVETVLSAARTTW
jgi:heptosyltransferase-2